MERTKRSQYESSETVKLNAKTRVKKTRIPVATRRTPRIVSTSSGRGRTLVNSPVFTDICPGFFVNEYFDMVSHFFNLRQSGYMHAAPKLQRNVR